MNDPGLDATLNLLAAGDRREILRGFRQEAAGETTIDDLAKRLAANDLVTETDSKQLSIQLYHTHMPKLDDFGLVEFDPERGTVRYQPNEPVEQVLDLLSESVHPATQSGSAN